MISIDNKIHIIENFISKETAEFLTEVIGSATKPTPDEFVLGGPMFSLEANKSFDIESKILWNFENNNRYNNVSLDIFNMIIQSMSVTISDFYNEKYVPVQVFYSKMIKNGKNDLHLDNYMYDTDMKVVERPLSRDDRSGLLYLNEDYEDGFLNFPKQNLKLKPKPGTFIFFEGNEDVPHEVTPVVSGERHNIISFYRKKTDIANNLSTVLK